MKTPQCRPSDVDPCHPTNGDTRNGVARRDTRPRTRSLHRLWGDAGSTSPRPTGWGGVRRPTHTHTPPGPPSCEAPPLPVQPGVPIQVGPADAHGLATDAAVMSGGRAARGLCARPAEAVLPPAPWTPRKRGHRRGGPRSARGKCGAAPGGVDTARARGGAAVGSRRAAPCRTNLEICYKSPNYKTGSDAQRQIRHGRAGAGTAQWRSECTHASRRALQPTNGTAAVARWPSLADKRDQRRSPGDCLLPVRPKPVVSGSAAGCSGGPPAAGGGGCAKNRGAIASRPVGPGAADGEDALCRGARPAAPERERAMRARARSCLHLLAWAPSRVCTAPLGPCTRPLARARSRAFVCFGVARVLHGPPRSHIEEGRHIAHACRTGAPNPHVSSPLAKKRSRACGGGGGGHRGGPMHRLWKGQRGEGFGGIGRRRPPAAEVAAIARHQANRRRVSTASRVRVIAVGPVGPPLRPDIPASTRDAPTSPMPIRRLDIPISERLIGQPLGVSAAWIVPSGGDPAANPSESSAGTNRPLPAGGGSNRIRNQTRPPPPALSPTGRLSRARIGS